MTTTNGRDQRPKPCAGGCGRTTRGTRCRECFAKIPARERAGAFGRFQLRPTHLKTGTTTPVNAPKDMHDTDPRSDAEIEAEIAQDAELGRRAVARHFPDDPDTGKATWNQLGIGKNR